MRVDLCSNLWCGGHGHPEARHRYSTNGVVMIDSLSSVPLPLPPIDAGLDSTGAFSEKTSALRMWLLSCAPSLVISIGGWYSSWIGGVSIRQKHCGDTWKLTPRPSVLNGCLPM